MQEDSLSGHLVSEFNHVPSGQMVIRRYQDLDRRFIENFFQKGPYCRHLPTFDDQNEGLLGEPGYDDGLRGALSAAGSSRRQEGDDIASDAEFEDALEDFHKTVRHKHFANCWRLGTDEPDEMWEEFIDDDSLMDGVAFETTVEQFLRALPREPADPDFYDRPAANELHETPMWNMHVGSTWSDIRVGAVRYQDREADSTVQPAAYQAAINFFKRKKYDYEREFRLLINPFDSATLTLANPDGTPLGQKPTVERDHRFLPMATRWMTNRLVLAPNAGAEQREKLESILDDIGIDYGSGSEADLEIVDSSIDGPSRSKTHEYDAEFRGQDNYEGTTTYLEAEQRDILQETSEEWETIDLVVLVMEKGGAVVEGYRYPTAEPPVDLNAYGHDELQGVAATRNGEHLDQVIEYRNTRMTEDFDE